MGWVISQDKKWEEYSNYLAEGVRVSRIGAPLTFALLWSWSLRVCPLDANVLQ